MVREAAWHLTPLDQQRVDQVHSWPFHKSPQVWPALPVLWGFCLRYGAEYSSTFRDATDTSDKPVRRLMNLLMTYAQRRLIDVGFNNHLYADTCVLNFSREWVSQVNQPMHRMTTLRYGIGYVGRTITGSRFQICATCLDMGLQRSGTSTPSPK
jgi:hypothetical protein